MKSTYSARSFFRDILFCSRKRQNFYKGARAPKNNARRENIKGLYKVLKGMQVDGTFWING